MFSDFDSARPIKVMAVGDSITDDCVVPGSWRQPLQPLLETNGFQFTFIGRQTSASAPGFTKLKHEGYCGAVVAAPGLFGAHQYSDSQNYLHKVVPEALATATPDVMLVLIGANDIVNGRNPFVVATNHMATLLNLIFSNAPNVNVVLAKATRQESYVGGGNGANIPIYNAALQGMVNQRRASGQKVYLADLYSVTSYPAMFSDGLHPNATGLQAIAREWLARLQTISVRTDLFTTAFISGGASWKYNDSGQDLGTNWTRIDYDDSAWSNGIARLGYGDSVTATTVGFGPQSAHKYVTTYFRRSFVVPSDRTYTNVNFRVAQADGAVIWLNGQEIYRTNMPAGPLSYTNLASKALTYYPRYTFYSTNVPMILPAGTNWVAVEVHLSSVTAAAMGFDMELIATGTPRYYGALQLSVPSAANESDGVLAGQGTVIASVAPTNDLVVTLSSSDTNGVTVPPSIIIPAGQTNVTFDINMIDDRVVDADRVATISAAALNYSGARASLTIHNTDKPTLLHLSIPAAATEGDGTLAGQGAVSVTPTPASDVTVALVSSDTTEVAVPATVFIPAGQSNAVFDLSVIDDALLDGDQTATISVSALNYTNAQAAITIHDNETATLSVILPQRHERVRDTRERRIGDHWNASRRSLHRPSHFQRHFKADGSVHRDIGQRPDAGHVQPYVRQ